VIFDPEDRQLTGPEIDVTGTPPPKPATSWWPWVIAAGVLGALWYLTKEERDRPLARGAG